jgi:hypothetical protein
MPATTGVYPERSRWTPTHLARAVPSALRGLTSVFGMGACRLRWQVDFCVAARHGSIDRFHDQPNMRPHTWPLLPAENHDGDFAPRKVLLISHVLIGSEQHVETIRFGGHKQFPILEPVPSLLRRSADFMSFEIGANRYRRRLIK